MNIYQKIINYLNFALDIVSIATKMVLLDFSIYYKIEPSAVYNGKYEWHPRFEWLCTNIQFVINNQTPINIKFCFWQVDDDDFDQCQSIVTSQLNGKAFLDEYKAPAKH